MSLIILYVLKHFLGPDLSFHSLLFSGIAVAKWQTRHKLLTGSLVSSAIDTNEHKVNQIRTWLNQRMPFCSAGHSSTGQTAAKGPTILEQQTVQNLGLPTGLMGLGG